MKNSTQIGMVLQKKFIRGRDGKKWWHSSLRVRVPLAGMVMEVPWEKTVFVIRSGRMGEVHNAAGERGFRLAGAASQRW